MRWLGSQGTAATPHSQRSHADVSVVLSADCTEYPLTALIEAIESAVATPVQAAVKRNDEQEFARRNAENLMFCEDSARRIRAVLETLPSVVDYRVQASHLESLHPHDAVAIVTKGVPGGLQP
jgi:GTP cyclohydrolase I